MRFQGDGVFFLNNILEQECTTCLFFDPQYNGIVEHLDLEESYGRFEERFKKQSMSDEVIRDFTAGVERVLKPSGYMFLWVDKFHLMTNFREWLLPNLEVVDMITWDKGRIGMGRRSRYQSEFCVVVQKSPRNAKATWSRHDIPDVWREKLSRHDKERHPHTKPSGLVGALIETTTQKGDLVVNPCAGSFITESVAFSIGRDFYGADLILPPESLLSSSLSNSLLCRRVTSLAQPSSAPPPAL